MAREDERGGKGAERRRELGRGGERRTEEEEGGVRREMRRECCLKLMQQTLSI